MLKAMGSLRRKMVGKMSSCISAPYRVTVSAPWPKGNTSPSRWRRGPRVCTLRRYIPSINHWPFRGRFAPLQWARCGHVGVRFRFLAIFARRLSFFFFLFCFLFCFLLLFLVVFFCFLLFGVVLCFF